MDVIGKRSQIRHLEARNEVLHAYSDHSKAKTVFGIKDEDFVDLKTGISRMAEWALKVGARKSNVFSNIEILEKLPPVWLEQTS
jgi:UDP-glucose 4-epimerase